MTLSDGGGHALPKQTEQQSAWNGSGILDAFKFGSKMIIS